MSACEICNKKMVGADFGADGTETQCLRCRRQTADEDAVIRALIDLSHRERRVPAELRRYPAWRIEMALDGVV